MSKAKNPLMLSVTDGNISIQNLDFAGYHDGYRFQPDPVILDPAGFGSGSDPQNSPDIR